MATITLKINERSKKGQVFMEFLKQYILNDASVEIIKTPNLETLKAIEDAKKGKKEKISLEQFRKQLY